MQVRSLPWILCLTVWLAAIGVTLNAQEVENPGASDTGLTDLLEAGHLEDQLASLSNRTDLASDALQETLNVHHQCLALRDSLIQLASERADLIQTTQSASNRLAELHTRLREPVAEPELDLPEDASSSALEQKSAEVEAEFTIVEAERDRLEQEPQRRSDRRVEIVSLLAEYRNNLQEPDSTAESADSTVPNELKQAIDSKSLLNKELNLQKIRNLNRELASYEATTDLLTAQQVLARRKADSLTKQLALIKDALNQSRAVESAKAANEAERARARAEALNVEVVTALAEDNKQFAQARVALSESLAHASTRLDEIEKDWRTLEANHESVRQLVQIAKESGVSQDFAIGMALRQEQYSLPSEKGLRDRIQKRAEQMTVARIERNELGDHRRATADIEGKVAEVRATLPPTLQEWQKDEAMEEYRRLLREQHVLFNDLAGDYSALDISLARLINAQKGWLHEIEQFNLLISEQVLWFRSTDVLSVEGVRDEIRTIVTTISKEVRTGLLPYLKKDTKQHPFIYVGALLLLLALLASRLPLTRALRRNCPTQLPEGRLSLKPALLTVLFTAILTVPIPAVLFFGAWRLTGYTDVTTLAGHWKHAFVLGASGVLIIEFLRQACRNPGLAVAHLRWPEHNAQLVRFHFTWVIMVGVPLGILSDLVESVFIEGLTNRMLFLVAQMLLLLLGHLMLRASRGLRFRTHDGETSVEQPLRLQRFYHAAAIMIPLLLIAVSVMGYTYTARQIWMRVGDSIQWGIVVLLLTMLILHWLTVLRRRMAMEKVEQREADGDSKEQEDKAGPDIWQVYSQSRRMFTTLLWIVMAIGLWVIWVDMMPALKKLDQIPIALTSKGDVEKDSVDMSVMSPVSALVPAPGLESEQPHDPSPASISHEGSPGFLSLADVIGAVLVLLLTMAASRNLPGFVEMVLLSRVRFRQGEGYAIVTILRYAVLLIGIGWALTLIGITWNKVQWLAAAMTVGIGFGLQEIFANFVSGLILLFERPVRVGDVITVGQVTGTVTRIQMRATTVRNFDQQELVLPNKDLITGQVINWTLSNDVSRFSLTIGVSYDADVNRACQLLLQIAKDNPKVRAEPEPWVTFDEFADSTLNLILRSYVSVEVRQSTKSELNIAILEKFREAGIEIAYPQRDLHLRSVTSDLPPLSARREAGDAPAS